MPYIYDENGKVVMHILGAGLDPILCPPLPANEKCPACRKRLEIEYGFCKFGLGAFHRCPKCYEVYGFSPDKEGEE